MNHVDIVAAEVCELAPGIVVKPAEFMEGAILKNYVSGKPGAPLDFISYHAKGRPTLVAGHVRMGIAKNLQDVSRGKEIVGSFPKFKNLPIILSECDPEGCASCGVRDLSQNTYRNGTLYPVYTAAALSNLFKLADRQKANIEGMLTWAFEFEDQPYLDGFRTLATNGTDKPVLSVFRMTGLMRRDRLKVESTGAVAWRRSPKKACSRSRISMRLRHVPIVIFQ